MELTTSVFLRKGKRFQREELRRDPKPIVRFCPLFSSRSKIRMDICVLVLNTRRGLKKTAYVHEQSKLE
jgi:hypothetical protein